MRVAHARLYRRFGPRMWPPGPAQVRAPAGHFLEAPSCASAL
jgi:hypothetical protein